MLNKDVPSLPPLFGLYTDELETYLDKINGDSLCLFNTMVAILLYVDDVVLLSRSCICLQQLLTSYMRFCTPSSLEVKLAKTKIMIFGRNKRKLNQEAFYLDKDQIEITHEYKYLGIDFYSHGYFEPSSKRQGIACVKALMKNLREEVVVGVTCWEHKSHLFEALVLPTFTYGTNIWGGDLKKTLIGKSLRRAWRCMWCLTSKCVLWLPIISSY